MEPEPTLDKRLQKEVRDLNQEQREIYDDVLNARRRELLRSGEGRNVGVEERSRLIDDIKEGRVERPPKPENPFPGVDPRKMERDFEAAGMPTKGAKED